MIVLNQQKKKCAKSYRKHMVKKLLQKIPKIRSKIFIKKKNKKNAFINYASINSKCTVKFSIIFCNLHYFVKFKKIIIKKFFFF